MRIAAGADLFIATGEEKGWAKTHSRDSWMLFLVLFLRHDMPFAEYLRLLSGMGFLCRWARRRRLCRRLWLGRYSEGG